MLFIDRKKKNLIVLWAANFFIAASLTMIMPFLSLYIGTFGNFPAEYVQRWSGIVFGATFITAFLFSPIWGRFGDRKGRKTVLIILGYGVSLSVFLMGFVTSVHLLLILRLFMGLFAGFISTAQAFIAAQTPKEEAGKILGTLQTGNVSGALFGPLIGGILADSVGFVFTFLITAIITAIAATSVWIWIDEQKEIEGRREGEKRYSRKEVVSYIFSTPMVLMVMLISTLVQTANVAITPLLALYVDEVNGTENLALLSGLAFSATGLGNLLYSRQWGKLGDKIGYEKVMILLLILCSIVYLPQGWVGTIWGLILLRFLLGLVIGGIIPCRVAYIRGNVPASIQGEMLGYLTSFRFLGNVIGPILGGFIASSFGISSVFTITSTLFVISAGLLWVMYTKEIKKTHIKETNSF